jgi:hypothetical protein
MRVIITFLERDNQLYLSLLEGEYSRFSVQRFRAVFRNLRLSIFREWVGRRRALAAALALTLEGQVAECNYSQSDQISASRFTVSGYRRTRLISSGACAFGLARPCSQFSGVRGPAHAAGKNG